MGIEILKGCPKELLTLSQRVIGIKDLILKCEDYDESFYGEFLGTVIAERLTREKQEKIATEEENISCENAFQLVKLCLQIEAQKLEHSSKNSSVASTNKLTLQIKNLVSNFDPKDMIEDNMPLLLNLFPRQIKFLKVAKENWVAYLLAVLPDEVVRLIARESDDRSQDFDLIKDMLL
ncbi:hypothetical protein HNY73_005107 [Argiope bruennichi]|uniref:Uncharacterized protein n=1 Tax=Argiope bruennichi TaxID=94029 RepID=A0A8T0FKE8_ARGBR|nr:hypothetical protein HNY73_005107 [Argiope bruennichi]